MALQNKPKPCKGRREAKGHGCGEVGIYNGMHRGLCPSCWADWLMNTEDGQRHIQKVSLKAKKEVGTKRRVETTRKKRELMSVDAYRAKVLQPVINEIVRLIDYGQPCIASGVTSGKFAGGHFYSVGANRHISLNLHNIHIQAYHSNGPQGGQPVEYLKGLQRVYGHDYADFILDLKKYRPIHKISKQDMEAAYPVACRIRNWLRKNQCRRTPAQRIRLRNIINVRLNLYATGVSKY